MAPMSNRVKVWKYFQGLTIETNNFAFEVKVILGLESTILNGRLDGRPDGEACNRTTGTGTGAEFGNLYVY